MIRLALVATFLLPGLALAGPPSKTSIKTLDKWGKKGITYAAITKSADKMGVPLGPTEEAYAAEFDGASFDRSAPIMIGVDFRGVSEGSLEGYRVAWLRTADGFRLAEIDTRWIDTESPAPPPPPKGLSSFAADSLVVAGHMQANTCDEMQLLASSDLDGLGFPPPLADMLKGRTAEAKANVAELCQRHSPTDVALYGGALAYGLFTGDEMSGIVVFELKSDDGAWSVTLDVDLFNQMDFDRRMENVELEMPVEAMEHESTGTETGVEEEAASEQPEQPAPDAPAEGE